MRTIFAPATPSGRSGVAVMRISGIHARECLPVFGINTPLSPRLATLKTLIHPLKKHTIDQVLLLWFPAPHSFTGEDTLEIHYHGSLAVKHDLLDALAGIPHFYPAEAGEFARQAFHNQKMDMSEVEGLADLLEAETLLQKKCALKQMDGHLSNICAKLRSDIIKAKAFIEAYIDFPDEEIPESVMIQLDNEVKEINGNLHEILKNSHFGEKIREGFTCVILGNPNAGKSTLINALAKREVAIVSDIEGTTRDLIELHLDIEGLPVSIIDTAGLRENPDIIEAEGIRRALTKAEQADVILLLTPADAQKNYIMPENLMHIPIIKILTKSDTLAQDIVVDFEKNHDVVLSVHQNSGLDTLYKRIQSTLSTMQYGDITITRVRHRTAFANALTYTTRYFHHEDVLLKAEELTSALHEIGSITGAIYLDDIYDKLFSSFCIGK